MRLLLVLSTVWLTSTAMAGDPATFNKIDPKLKYGSWASTMAASEDGRYVFIGHVQMGSVTVWDVKEAKVAATLECSKPSSLLSRGEQLFVANEGKGTITAFSTKTWQKTGTIQLLAIYPVLLSAPVGKHYEGKFLATCTDGLAVVDAKAGKATAIYSTPEDRDFWAVMVSADGNSYVNGSELWASSLLKHGIHNASNLRRVDWGYAYQTQPGPLWFVNRTVLLNSAPLRDLKADFAAVPDSTAPVFYLMGQTTIAAHRLNATADAIGEQAIQLPQPMQKYFDKAGGTGKQPWQNVSSGQSRYFQPVLAFTLDKELFVFLLEGRDVWWAKLPAFNVPSDKPAPDGRLAVVPTTWTIDDIMLSEDGRKLFASSQAGNVVGVFDVATSKLEQQLACQKADLLLCRGDRLFVSRAGKATIAVFSLKDYKLTDELSAGTGSIVSLSAGHGSGFKDTILAKVKSQKSTCHVLIDARADTAQRIAVTEGHDVLDLQMSCDGTSVVANGSKLWTLQALLEGKVDPSANDVTRQSRSLRQITSGYWVGEGGVFAEPNLASVLEPDVQRRLLVPDALVPQVYDLTKDRLTIRKLDKGCTAVGHVPVDISALYASSKLPFGRGTLPTCAVSVDGKLVMYVLSQSRLLRLESNIRAAATSGPSGALPAAVNVGKTVKYQIMLPPALYKATILRGPTTVRVSESGLVEWTPTPQEIGHHNIKVRLDSADQAYFFRMSVEVLPQGADPAKLPLTELLLTDPATAIVPGDGRKSMLVLAGQELKVLSPDGLHLLKSVILPKTYSRVLERPTYYVAVTKDGVVELVDKAKTQVIRQIKLPCASILDLVLSPRNSVSYAAVVSAEAKDHDTLQEFPIIAVNEKTAVAKVVEGAFGERLATDPRGAFLYATLYDTSHRGFVLDHWGSLWEVRAASAGVLAYVPQEMSLRPSKVTALSGRAQSIAVTADGKTVLCPTDSAVQSFQTRGLKALTQMRQIPDFFNPSRVVLHPVLPLMAYHDAGGIVLLDMEGRPLKTQLDLQGEQLDASTAAAFSLDGRTLILSTRDRRGRPVLRMFALGLSPAAIAQLATTTSGPAGSAGTDVPSPATPVVDRKDLLILQPLAKDAKLSSKEIGNRYMDSVVLVGSGRSSGSGMHVGSGYVLTCAHVLAGETATVSYRAKIGQELRTVKVDAKIVRTDPEADLALLKVDLPAELEPVRLSSVKLETGEAVTVIANPGLGAQPLAWTLTTGIVSNAKQKVGEQVYVQIDAAVNPGSSGGPVFDETGRLIGVVVQKGIERERIGLAINAETIRDFLEACSSKPTSRPAK